MLREASVASMQRTRTSPPSGEGRWVSEGDLLGRIVEAVRTSADDTVPTLRTVRRWASSELESRSGEEVLAIAERALRDVPRWFVYELVHHHGPAIALLDGEWLGRLGKGMSSWGEVDPFACYLSGVAWREGQVSDGDIHRWAASSDRWWRRAALVSTVPLNSRARGGGGDAARTLAMCDALRSDRDDMVVKACSWALRELTKRDPEAVRAYLSRRETELAPRVVREVSSKLETGRKRPRRDR